jgi:membrane fusion protein (multidrug efflux system)
MSWTVALPRRVVPFAVLALLAVLPQGCQKEAAPAEEAAEEHSAPVKWEKAEKADLEEWTELLGTTQPLPNRVARISAGVEGYVLAVLPASKGKAVVEGQRVEKDQIIVRLDDRFLRANRAKLVAGEEELKEQINQAGTALELARLDMDRLVKLVGPDQTGSSSLPLVSRLEIEKARLAVKDAESKYKAAQAKAGVARAELKAIDEQLTLFELRTPIAGQLGMVHAVAGQELAIGTSVAEVIDLEEIDVLCFVPARTVAHMRLDQLVRIDDVGELTDDSSKVEQGRIVFISEQAQAETGTIAVKARFPNRTRKLRANTLIRVRVLTEKKPDCLSIPEAALLEDQEEPAVLVVTTEKKKNAKDEEEEEHEVHKYQVKLGLRDRDKHKVEIVGLIDAKEKKAVPLEKDTLFVVEGGHGLEDGDHVKEKEEEHKEGEAKEGAAKEGDAKKDEHKEGDNKKEEPKKDAHK